MLCSLAQPFLAEWHRTNLTGESQLAKGNQRAWHGLVCKRGTRRHHNRQIAGGLREAHAAHHIRKHVLTVQHESAVAMRDGEQHGQTIAVDADRHTARIGTQAVVGQHLHFDQQRPGSLAHHGNDAARDRLRMPRQENRRRVRHLAQALFQHGEHTNFVGSAESVFH